MVEWGEGKEANQLVLVFSCIETEIHHKQNKEPEFLDFQGAKESIPRSRFLQPM